MKLRILLLVLGVLLLTPQLTSALKITDQPSGTHSWDSSRIEPYIVKYETDVEEDNGVQATVIRSLIFSSEDLCEKETYSPRTLIAEYPWNEGGTFDLDLVGQAREFMNANNYDNPDIAYDIEDGNGYICILIYVKLIIKIPSSSLRSNEIIVKVYKDNAPDQGGGIFDVSIPIYMPIITLGLLVLLKRRRI